MFGRPSLVTDASARDRLIVSHSDDDYAIGSIHHYLITVWRTQFSLNSAVHWGRVLIELRAAQPQGRLGTLSYVEPACVFPVPPAVAQTFVDLLRRHADLAAAVVYGREGFWGAGLRSQVTSVINESKAEVPHLVAANVAPAAAWLVEKLADAAPDRAATLVKAVEQLRETAPFTLKDARR